MRRWAWLLILLACERTPSREDVLRALVVQVVVPETGRLAEAAHALRVGEHDARERWLSAALAWERMQALQLGPIVDDRGLLRARYFPIREQALATRLREPLDARQVAQLGADLRGMYALEWLLWEHPDARAFALLAADAEAYARSARDALGDGSALIDTLAQRPQESVARWLTQMVAVGEQLSRRLAEPLEQAARGALRVREVQGSRSGSSLLLLQAQLDSLARQYDVLAPLVSAVAPQIDARLRERFARATRALAATGAPIEQAVVRDRARVLTAFRALRELVGALQVDLASALGITLTFTGADAD